MAARPFITNSDGSPNLEAERFRAVTTAGGTVLMAFGLFGALPAIAVGGLLYGVYKGAEALCKVDEKK